MFETRKSMALFLTVMMLAGCSVTDIYKYKSVTVGTGGDTTLRTLNEQLKFSDFYKSNGPLGSTNTLTTYLYTLPGLRVSTVAPGLAESSFATSVLFFNTINSNGLSVIQLNDGVLNGVSTGRIYDSAYLTQLTTDEHVNDSTERQYFVDLMASIKDAGIDADGILAWGRWTDPNLYIHGDKSTECCSANQSLHYVFGTPTPNANIPTSGTAVFTLVGATAPTIDSGALPAGSLNAGSTVGVVWGGAAATQVGVNLSGQIGGLPFVVQTTGGSANPALSGVTYNSATRSFSGLTPDEASFNGFFAGTDASHIGLSYTAPVSGVVEGNPVAGTVQGAAAFKR